MTMIHHSVTLVGADSYGSRLPPAPVGMFLSNLDAHIRGAVSVAFRGRSRAPGRPPAWLEAASDVRLLGVSGRDEAVLHFEAPTFSTAAPSLYSQGEFWMTRPRPDATGFEVFARVLRDVKGADRESDLFEPRMLRGFRTFRRSIGAWFREARIEDVEGLSSRFVTLDSQTIDAATSLGSAAPPSRRVRVAGVLDMLRLSTQTFGIKLDTGDEVRGSIAEASGEILGRLLGERVVIDGRAVFRPSGRLLRVDADSILPGEGVSTLFSKPPEAIGRRALRSEVRHPQSPATGVNAFFGRWPGEETDEELLRELDDLH
ncbi:hypothetical protein MYXO_03141 [Myxococcaceae bacterium]|jgi:hypothetical protein|nr:hypothetical protein MYXO_03141 [Myxococcaceae bacterium]